MENEKVARILAACSDFEREDFVALAMAALDQADTPRSMLVDIQRGLWYERVSDFKRPQGVGR